MPPVYLIPGETAAGHPGVARDTFLNMIVRAASWQTIVYNEGKDTG
jgi:hypothetical protein